MTNQLRVYRHTNKQSIEENVENIQEAIDFINEWSAKDLKDNSIEWNAFGLEEFNPDSNEFEEYYNENGEDILEIIDNLLC